MNSLLFFTVLAISCALSFLVVNQVRLWALAKNRLDIPNERSSHQVPTPRGGGIGIFVVTVSVFLIAYSLFFADTPLLTVVVYCLTAVLVAVTGWLDDRQTLPVLVRLAAYSGAVLLFVLGVGIVNIIQIPAVTSALYLPAVLGVILTYFWLAGFINAFNFMDGIDGLAGAQALIAACAWCLLFRSENLWTLSLLAGLVAATSVGFLFLNLPPAKIFMGDVGSTFLGFTLAALPVLAFQDLHNPRLFTAGILIVAPFLFDTILTLVRRALKKENILKAHRSHLYQRLVIAGFSHAKVTTLYSGLALVCALCGLLYYFGSETLGVLILLLLLGLHLGLLFGVRTVENRCRGHNGIAPAAPKAEISG